MTQKSKTESLYEAIAKFQAEAPTILKYTEAGQGSFKYQYADLPAIFDEIKPLLLKHGLGFVQAIDYNAENDVNILVTKVFHVDTKEHVTSKMRIKEGVELKGQNEYQTLGSAITYYRRYVLSSLLGIVTDKDNDAQGEQPKGNKSNGKNWLNPGSDIWISAVAFLGKNKGTIKQIEHKYRISKINREKLMAEAMDYEANLLSQ
jgi:hypothetical protein